MAKVCFEVTTNAKIAKVSVDGVYFPFPDLSGCIELESGRHRVRWVAEGEPGQTIKIVGRKGEDVVVTREAELDGEGESFGGKDFHV